MENQSRLLLFLFFFRSCPEGRASLPSPESLFDNSFHFSEWQFWCCMPFYSSCFFLPPPPPSPSSSPQPSSFELVKTKVPPSPVNSGCGGKVFTAKFQSSVDTIWCQLKVTKTLTLPYAENRKPWNLPSRRQKDTPSVHMFAKVCCSFLFFTCVFTFSSSRSTFYSFNEIFFLLYRGRGFERASCFLFFFPSSAFASQLLVARKTSRLFRYLHIPSSLGNV